MWSLTAVILKINLLHSSIKPFIHPLHDIHVSILGIVYYIILPFIYRVNHSKNAIVKPQGKTPEMAQREVDEAMRKVRQATHAISTAIEPGIPFLFYYWICIFNF